MERKKKELTEEQAFMRLARLCSTTEYCRRDMQRKMSAWQLPEGAEERVLTRLEKEGFIDEVRYAHAYVRDKFRHNRWGRHRIEMELRKRNIADEIIQDALTEITSEDSDETLEGLLRTKLKTVKGKSDYDVFLKLLRFSVGRGFPQDQAHRCLKRIINTEEFL